jgi:tetratricopeptide (TPR) repeat protein
MAVSREQVVQTAEKYVSRGKIEPAIREYKKLLAENPNDINTLNRVGDLYARLQRIDDAADFFNQIAEQYSVEGFFVKAIAIYKKIIKLDPTRLEVYERLADLYHQQGLINEARTQYQVLADYYQKHANAASAIAIYQKMADLEPENPSYHVRLAEIYQAQQLTEKALGEYRVIAELMLKHGKAQEAAQVYERALAVDSANLGFIANAVTALRQGGHTAAAARLLAVAVERNPAARQVASMIAEEAPPPAAFRPAPAPRPSAPPPATPAPIPAPSRPAPPAARSVATPVSAPPPMVEAAGPETVEIDLAAEIESAPALPEVEMDIEAEPEPVLEATFSGLIEAAFEAEEAVEEPAVAAFAADAASVADVADTGEIELDLGEVFVLDMEEEESPSQVKPPPDMLGQEHKRPAWALAADDEPAAAEPAPGRPAAVAPEVESADEEVVLDLDVGLPSLDEAAFSIADTGEVPLRTGAAAGPSDIDRDLLERTVAEVQEGAPGLRIDRDEDLVSEAEVLAKYGLADKALDRLREALGINPENLGAYALLIQLSLDQGHDARVVELANQLAEVSARLGDATIWPEVRTMLHGAGFLVEEDRVAFGTAVEAEMVLEPEAPASAPELDLAAPLTSTWEPEPPPAAPPAAAAERRAKSAELDKLVAGLLAGPRAKKKPAAPAPKPAPLPPVAAAPPAPVETPTAPVELVEIAAELSAAPAAAEPPSPSPRPVFNPLEIGEMVEREEWDDDEWVRTPAAPLVGVSPDDLPAGFVVAAQEPAVASSGVDAAGGAAGSALDDSGMNWLDEAEVGRTEKTTAGLFDAEDDFFDLAAQLEEELSKEGALAGDGLLVPQAQEQSLEEIVEGFKKGVAEHLSPTDYDTHFNLGIAYREMGLLDEAIGEFQLAAKDPRHLLVSCSMLGLCFVEKGIPELAVKWYHRGLEAPNLGEEDNLGLLYDLGCAYLQMGDHDTAYKTFVEVYGINTNYRDIVARIEELGRR